MQVPETEGASLAASYGIGFCEVSVAENTASLYKAFERLLNDSKGRPVKQRKFSVSKMIGKLILTYLITFKTRTVIAFATPVNYYYLHYMFSVLSQSTKHTIFLSLRANTCCALNADVRGVLNRILGDCLYGRKII